MNEKEVISRLNEILEGWQEILNIKDKVEREIEMSMYFEEMPFKEIQTVLQLLEQKDKRIDELEKALVEEAIKSKVLELYNQRINKLKDKLKKDIKNNKSGINLMDLRCIGKWQEAKEILKILEE